MDLRLQIDKKMRGLFAGIMDDMDLDERYVSFVLPNGQLVSPEQTAETLARIIQQEYEKI